MGPGALTRSPSAHVTAATRLESATTDAAPSVISVPAAAVPPAIGGTAAGGRALPSGVWPGLVGLVALVPVLAGALGVVAPIAYGLHLAWPDWGAVAPFAVWGALVPLSLTPGARLLTARVAYGCREPDAAERDRIDRPWRRAVDRAGVSAGRFRLLVMDSAELNACTPTGRIVAVTSHSARSLSPDRLEAVLVHELAHRLGRQGVLTQVTAQLMLPIGALRWVLRAMWSPVAPMWRRAVAWHRPIGFLLTFLLAIAAAAVTVVVAVPAAIALGAVAVTRPLNGQAEYEADTTAVRLGLGTALLATLEHAIETARPDRAEQPPALPMPLVRRAGRLRKRLAG
jgi:Zn-dependent protease with chaperone function